MNCRLLLLLLCLGTTSVAHADHVDDGVSCIADAARAYSLCLSNCPNELQCENIPLSCSIYCFERYAENVEWCESYYFQLAGTDEAGTGQAYAGAHYAAPSSTVHERKDCFIEHKKCVSEAHRANLECVIGCPANERCDRDPACVDRCGGETRSSLLMCDHELSECRGAAPGQ